MQNENEEIHVETDDVRGGESRGVMRWVLGIGVLLAAALMTIIWVTGALTQGPTESEATVSGKMDAMEDGDSTDSIVGVPDDASMVEPSEDMTSDSEGNSAGE